jgi:hypothetical protein
MGRFTPAPLTPGPTPVQQASTPFDPTVDRPAPDNTHPNAAEDLSVAGEEDPGSAVDTTGLVGLRKSDPSPKLSPHPATAPQPPDSGHTDHG